MSGGNVFVSNFPTHDSRNDLRKFFSHALDKSTRLNSFAFLRVLIKMHIFSVISLHMKLSGWRNFFYLVPDIRIACACGRVRICAVQRCVKYENEYYDFWHRCTVGGLSVRVTSQYIFGA